MLKNEEVRKVKLPMAITETFEIRMISPEITHIMSTNNNEIHYSHNKSNSNDCNTNLNAKYEQIEVQSQDSQIEYCIINKEQAINDLLKYSME